VSQRATPDLAASVPPWAEVPEEQRVRLNSRGKCWFWLQAGPQAEEGEGALLQRSGLDELVEAGLVVSKAEAVLDQGGPVSSALVPHS
jgi:hypothetical protein